MLLLMLSSQQKALKGTVIAAGGLAVQRGIHRDSRRRIAAAVREAAALLVQRYRACPCAMQAVWALYGAAIL